MWVVGKSFLVLATVWRHLVAVTHLILIFMGTVLGPVWLILTFRIVTVVLGSGRLAPFQWPGLRRLGLESAGGRGTPCQILPP